MMGMFVPITFEIFDTKFSEGSDSKYYIEMRHGTSPESVIFRETYHKPGIVTEKVFFRRKPGYHTIMVRMRTSYGLVYDDVFHFGFNINVSIGLAAAVFLPFVLISVPLFASAKQIRPGINSEESVLGR
jgi:hypothetical protein